MGAEKKRPTIQKGIYLLATLISVSFVCFHLFTAGYRELLGLQQRLVHLTLGLMLAYIVAPLFKKKGPGLVDLFFVFLAAGAGTYILLNINTIEYNFGNNSIPETVAAAVLVFLVLEITRRLIGWPLPIISGIALLYGFFGHLLSGTFSHAYLRPVRYIAHIGLSTEGIFSTPLSASASIVAMFIIFAAILNSTGAGQYFIDLVMGRFGQTRGGAAKAAVVGSALMGTLTGSVIANVMGTGTFTIPLMKEHGYRPVVAGAVEAVSSTGGQIMPPVMGAAAYIICELLNIPFITLMKAVAVPAIFYYLAEFIFVDLEACKYGLFGLNAEQTLAYRRRSKGKFYLILPLFLIIVLMIFLKMLPQRAAFWAFVCVFVIGLIQPGDHRLNPRKILEMMKSAARNCVEAIAACACAGIIVGTLSITGLGLHLSYILIGISGGNLLILLILTMIVALILGMGLTTTASYIILAVLVAPTLIKMGVNPIAAHLFVFYFGCYSAITPPVAMGAYVAASLAGSEPFKTGYVAWRIALPSFLVPFMFVYSPALLMEGRILEIILVVGTACIGVWFTSISVVGYFRKNLAMWERVLMMMAGLCMIIPEHITDVVGVVIGLAFLMLRGGKRQTPEERFASMEAAAIRRSEAAAADIAAADASKNKKGLFGRKREVSTVETIDTFETVGAEKPLKPGQE